jgi:hypothetical protein
MRDFTLMAYRDLLLSAKKAGYELISYEDYIGNGGNYPKVFILRHDVDDLPWNSYRTAVLEKEIGATGSYYFRIVKQSLNPEVIRKIAELGHEIGYHYEDVALTHGNIGVAFENFKINLEKIRSFYPVKTICMHGSPLSKWDNRLLWKEHNYKELGILAEPYFDLDFDKVFYLTDTGRGWNKTGSAVRDKVNTKFNFNFHSTADIISAFQSNGLPAHIMLNIHPQRWNDALLPWTKELILQNTKNVVKSILIRNRE